jgi:hypothetical protein
VDKSRLLSKAEADALKVHNEEIVRKRLEIRELNGQVDSELRSSKRLGHGSALRA